MVEMILVQVNLQLEESEDTKSTFGKSGAKISKSGAKISRKVEQKI